MTSQWTIQRGLLVYECECHTTTNWIPVPAFADKLPDPKCCTLAVAPLPNGLAKRLRGTTGQHQPQPQRKAAFAIF
jgi:hypothetical protein